MFSRGVALLAMIWVALFAQSAAAFFDPPWITPENPKAGETVYVNIRYGVCDGIFQEDGYPQISRQGSAIRMRWSGDHWPEGSGVALCTYPVSTLASQIGAFPSGDYTLTAEFAYRDFFGVPEILTIGVVPFTVAVPPAPVSVPTLGMLGVLALATLLPGLALVSLRTRRTT